ncbi:hypothetical protein HB662_23150 [Roseomonas frigidaquae]|uniref:Uncharacterized protein n=1 Tax=Falsiroseomonas frigidaquae TaxID=487318 RepID=A0ABX1F5P5_9PROT|nr:DUF6212 domain-containing protein [Falsiroseomonas frigidaquae]NKE47694.1 hypothetical protein [Falsiroseomonas frigidaquae]
MTEFLIGAAERAALAAGEPAVVAAAGMKGLDTLPLVVLRPVQGVLRRGAADGPAESFPPGLAPLALLAPDAAAAAALAAGLPQGVPQILGPDPLPALLDLALQALAAAQAARIALQGQPGSRPPAMRSLVIDLPPLATANAPPEQVTQHLGRPAEGLCGIALHVAAARATAASLLRVRLLAAGRVLGAWTLPGDLVTAGWLQLDLPEPASPGAAEAVLEVGVELASGEVLVLSSAGTGPAAPLALRAETAEPHHLVLPWQFDWAACGVAAPRPGLALPVPRQAWDAARVDGAEASFAAAGAEAPRMMLEIPPGAEARLDLPTLPPGAADLALAELHCRLGEPAGLQVALQAGPEAGPARDSGWRIPDPGGALRIALPLPAGLGGAVRLGLAFRNRGAAAVTVEVAMLALMAGAAGVTRRVPPQARIVPHMAASAPQLQVPLPAFVPAATEQEPESSRPELSRGEALPAAGLPGPAPQPAAPPPPLAGGEAGAPAPAPAPATTPMTLAAPTPAAGSEMAPGGADFQDIKLHQHSVNADGSYRHIELGLSGLVSASGVWREVRLKLFDRRGTIGLEFRRIKGWPQMFEAWPQGGSDQFGPYWRLETEAAATALARLTSAQDRAMLAALLELLPSLVRRAARVAGLPAEEQEAWADRGRALVAAVDAARLGPTRVTATGPG